MQPRRALMTVSVAAFALLGAACIPPRGVPPELSTTTTTSSSSTTSTTLSQETTFQESEANNSPATADVIPAAVSGYLLQGSLNDSDDPATGDTDNFRLTAANTGTFTVTCQGNGFEAGATLTVQNLTSGAAADTGPCTTGASYSVDADAGDTILVTLFGPTGGGVSYSGLLITN